MVSPLIPAFTVFAVWLVLHSYKDYLGDVFLFFYFWFMYANLESSSNLSTFYLFGMLFVMIVTFSRQKWGVGDGEVEGYEKYGIRKLGIPLISIIIGVIMFLMKVALNGKAGGAIIGVPTLSISFASWGPSTIAILGIIENRVFFSAFELLRSELAQNIFYRLLSAIPVLGQVIFLMFQLLAFAAPFIVVSVIFSMFHRTAYGAGAASSFVFAAIVMFMYLISYIFTKKDTAADTAHWMWNLWVTVSKILTIVR